MSKPSDINMAGAITERLVQNTTVYANLDQDALIITEDRVRLCLLKHLNRLEARRHWIAPAGILVTIVATFMTSTFKDFLYLKGATWQAIFIVAGVLTFGWLVWASVRAFRAPGIEDVVATMKETGARLDTGDKGGE